MKRLLSPLLATMALVSLHPTHADACGAVFRHTTTVTVPSLQVEQVLVIHDPVKEEEHFIRQLAFRNAKEPFGFIVPTPSRPTVAKVASSPFAELAKRFSPEASLGLSLGLGGGGFSAGGVGKGASPRVTVLSQERIGSFTAFVLAANDASALARWLKLNAFETTPESRAWLAHYVAVGFYFTAFRYEPDSKVPGTAVKSETVRISFATPLPFYPYREPEHPKDDASASRVLAVWFVSPQRSLPVASFADDSGDHLKRPWTEDTTHPDTTAQDLRPVLGPLADLLPGAPTAPLVMQTFEDQKSSRQGWGDVVLVPATTQPIDPARRERMGKLTASLGAGK
jgi:hypothetical protein